MGKQLDTCYTALSYSWVQAGRRRPQREQIIKNESKVSIGLAYIWVDALRIVQPDEHDHSDWDKEVKLMCDVYRNAHLSIAAVSAHSVQEGCFFKEPVLDFPLNPCRVDDLCGSTRAIEGETWVNPITSMWDEVRYSHLTTRGWCLQERLMSSRTVHLTKQGVFWKCQELEASEYAVEGGVWRSVAPHPGGHMEFEASISC